MAADNEPAKLLLPYLQRADELQKHEPLVAYYCRLYAMERGLKIPQSERTKTTNSLLVSLIKQLEKDKKSLQLGPDDHLHLEGFALNVFAKADKQDRAGRADLNTAKTFYAASIFFEILYQFGEVHPDLEQKQKYAAWKAADIRKALKEGRKPLPGPPGGDQDLSNNGYDLGPSRSDLSIRPSLDSESSDQVYDQAEPKHFSPSPSSKSLSAPPSNFSPSNAQPPPPSNFPRSDSLPSPPSNFPTSSSLPSPPSNFQSTPSYPTTDYSSHNFQHPSGNGGENSSYPQPYHHQPYPQEPQQNLPPNYIPQEPQQNLPPNYIPYEPPSQTYPNFQSYPSFSESTLPTVPSHYPASYYQGADTSYAAPPASERTNFPSASQYNASGSNGKVSETAPTSVQAYQYDSNYQPPPEKIAEAHKAARFAVGALAFDDVYVAVDYLKKSLELLTNPSAGQ